MQDLRSKISRAYTVFAAFFCMAATIFADIPAPKADAGGADWSFIAGGLLFAFTGALVFVLLGRKFSKRSSK